MRNRWIVCLLIPCMFSSFVARPAIATCGGGGGGGSGGAGQAYETTWTKSAWRQVIASAKLNKQGVLLYFQRLPKNKGARVIEHRFFKTKWPNDTSKERQFFKVEKKEPEGMRTEFRAPKKQHAVFVCDWYGNGIKRFEARDKSKFKGNTIGSTLFAMGKIVRKLDKKLMAALAKGKKSAEANRYPAAIKSLQDILAYKGYPAVKPALEIWGTVIAAGYAELEEAAQLEGTKKRLAVGALKRKFKGTEVAKACEDVLAGRTPTRGEGKPDGQMSLGPDSLAEQAWVELFGDVDFDNLPPTVSERVGALVRAGIDQENAGRYERARDSYALAAGLDANDAVPMMYLGELYRHHLGDWNEAKKCMRRVVELDSNDRAVAIALHGLGKMTIWSGDNQAGLDLFRRSLECLPTALCYRNLAVYWNTEGDAKKAYDYAQKAYELNRHDAYNQVFFSVYLLLNGQQNKARQLMDSTEFDPSMSYNLACYHAVKGNRDKVMHHLKRHFQEYERYDAVRSFEMAEARMDGFFVRWYEDPEFQELTALAGKTPWLK